MHASHALRYHVDDQLEGDGNSPQKNGYAIMQMFKDIPTSHAINVRKSLRQSGKRCAIYNCSTMQN